MAGVWEAATQRGLGALSLAVFFGAAVRAGEDTFTWGAFKGGPGVKLKLVMKLNVDLPQLDEVLTLLAEIQKTLKEIAMTGAEALAAIQAVGTQLTKAKDEILAKIAQLEASLANANLSPEAEAALADLKTQAQALDDVVPDTT